MLELKLRDKETALANRLRQHGSMLVAFSGGVDSSVLLAAAARALPRKRVLAVTARSPTFPAEELRQARAIARGLKVRHRVIETSEFDNPRFVKNTARRCYHCKGELFAELVRVAREERGLSVHLGDLEDVPEGKGSFDALTFFHVLEHLPDPLRTLRRAQELLNQEGCLLIQCPNIESAQFKRFGPRWLHLSLPQHFYHFSPGTLGQMLEKAGFRVMQVGHLSLRMNPMSAVLSRHPGLLACVFPVAKGKRGSTAAEKALYLTGTYLARPRVRLESWLREGATLTVLARKVG